MSLEPFYGRKIFHADAAEDKITVWFSPVEGFDDYTDDSDSSDDERQGTCINRRKLSLCDKVELVFQHDCCESNTWIFTKRFSTKMKDNTLVKYSLETRHESVKIGVEYDDRHDYVFRFQNGKNVTITHSCVSNGYYQGSVVVRINARS